MDNFHSSCLLQHAELLSTRPLPIHSSQQHGVASSCPWKTPQMVLLQSASGETLPCEQLSSARPRVDFWQIPKGEFPASSPGVCVCILSRFSRVRLFGPPWTVGHQAPLSMEFSRQEYWSGLLCPSPGHHPHPAIKPTSPAAAALQTDSLLLSPRGSSATGVASHEFSSESTCSNTV